MANPNERDQASPDLKIHREELEDIVAIAADLQAKGRKSGDDTLHGDALDVIVETTGLTREQLAEAQKRHQAKKDSRTTAVIGGLAALLIAGLLTKGLWWERVFPLDPQVAAAQIAQVREGMRAATETDKDPKTAIRLGLNGVDRFPSDMMLWNDLGRAYEEDGQDGEAVRCFKKAIELSGTQRDAAWPHYHMGRMMVKAGRHEEAIRYYERSLQLWPNDKWAQRGMGVAYERMGQMKKAAESYEAALKLDPSFTYAREGLARVKGQ